MRETKIRSSISDAVRSSKKLRKRHSSFVIKTLASQRIFFRQFNHKYNKSKLLKETSYKR